MEALVNGRKERMKALIDGIWYLERNLVSDGFDRALELINEVLPLTIHQYPSGSEVWTWIVPEKWTCYEAYVETLNGKRVIDRRNNPLHCASYSASFDGVVTKEELFKHLSVHDNLRDAIPFSWKYYKMEWGLCCSAEQRDLLTDDKYRVLIRTEHTPGTLKVGECVLPGSSEKEFILCAHLCHPCMVNDDLSGVSVGVEVMRHLMAVPNRSYSYRLLLTPETIGSVAWLGSHQELIRKIAGGLFLEMLGTDCPHALQLSYHGNTEVDQCLLSGLKECDANSWSGPFRRVIGNDERQFNAPGVRIPMLSLSRVFHRNTGKWPYPEYHSSKDTPDFISWDRLDESVDVVLYLIRRLEENQYPVNMFRGEVFCSRYGLFIDAYDDPDGNRRLFDIIQMIDGTNSVNHIADSCNIPFSFVSRTLRRMEERGLIRFSQFPVHG